MPPVLFEQSEYTSALLDQQGNWWLATSEEGLQKISPYKQHFKSTPVANPQTGSPIKYEVNDVRRQNNILWIGTYGEGLFRMDLATGELQQRRNNTSSWGNFIWNIRLQNPDTLWAGTQNGLFWHSIASNRFGRVSPYPGKPVVLDSVAITTQFIDSHGLN
jgi:ligand-binding sensor domain-containing protein